MSKKKRAVAHDRIEQLELPFLWANKNGSLSLHRRYRARSSVSRLLRLQRSPRGEVVRASRLLRSQFLSSWLGSKNMAVIGFGKGKIQLFEMWLSNQLESAVFMALTLVEVVNVGAADLQLERAEV